MEIGLPGGVHGDSRSRLSRWRSGLSTTICTALFASLGNALLTSSSREPYEDVESIISGLFRPELRDALPVQHPNTILFDYKLTKRIRMYIEIYIDLQKHRKVSVYATLYSGL